MCDLEHEEINRFFEYLGSKRTCVWCKHPKAIVMKRTGLCSHCNRIKLQIKNYEKQGIRNFDYEVAVKKKARAVSEGITYGDIHKAEISALNLEHELGFLGTSFVGKDFFRNEATFLGHTLCPIHRKYLYYIISLHTREHLRKYRNQMASYDVIMDD